MIEAYIRKCVVVNGVEVYVPFHDNPMSGESSFRILPNAKEAIRWVNEKGYALRLGNPELKYGGNDV